MKSRIQNLLLALAISLFPALARAADTTSWVVNKHQQFNQTNSGPAVLQSQGGGPYTFEVGVHANAPGPVLGLTVKLPGGTSQTVPTNPPSNGFGFGMTPSFPSLAALDAAYPAGQYVLTITNANDGIKRVTNNLPASVYPSTPHVSNYDAVQNINPLVDFTLTWDAFTNGTASDLIELQVSDANGNTVLSSPLNFGPGTLTGLSNSVVISANTLAAGQTYSAQIWFYKIINFDTTSYPGATGYTLFWKRTFFNLQTANPFGIFPITTKSNLVEVASGSATSGTNGLAAILSGTNVCYRLVSTNGTLIGPLTIIGKSTSFPLAAFGGGKYLVYWDDNFVTSGPSIFGQVVSPNGTLVGSPFFIPSTGNGAPRALASDGTNFLAIMEENNNYYGQIVTPAGTLSGSQFLISSQLQNGNSAAAIFAKTNYFVVWQSSNGSGGNTNKTYGEFISASGTAGSPFQISQTVSLDQNPLAIGFDGTNYLVIWNVDTNRMSSGTPVWSLYGRLVSQTGTFPGNELILNTNQALFPSLAFDGANYLFCWSYNLDTTNANKNVFFQFLNRSATPVGPAFTIFQSAGTNTPLAGGVAFNGSQFGVGGSVGVLQVAGDGSIQGFLNCQSYGAFVPRSTASPTMAATFPLVGTQFSLQLTGTPGINYAVQFSTNLAPPNWTAFATNSPTNGTFNFIDTHATNKSRFYRAVKQ